MPIHGYMAEPISRVSNSASTSLQGYIDKDEAIFKRFNSRLTIILKIVLLVYGVLLVAFIPFASLPFTGIHFAIFLITCGLFVLIKDRFLFLLTSNAAFFWSFATYLYSALHWKPVEEGLFDPITSSLLGLLLLVASAAGVGLVRSIRVSSRLGVGRSAAAMHSLLPFRGAMVAVGLIALSITAVFPDPTVSSIMGAFSFLTWLGLALDLMAVNGRFASSSLLLMAVGVSIVVALALNARAIAFSSGLFIVFAYVIFAPKLWNPKVIVATYFVFSLASVFSDAVLSVRLSGERETGYAPLVSTIQQVVSIDTLTSIVFPFRTSSLKQQLVTLSRDSYSDDAFSTRFFGLQSGFDTRFVNLPFADMVCGRIGAIDTIRWDRLVGLIVNALPYVGIAKSENYADLVTWEMGVRYYGSVGYPMITSVCELYTMGGWIFAFFLSMFFWVLIAIWYDVFVNAIGFRAAHLLVFVQFSVGLTFTTGIATMLVPLIRGFPFILLTLFLLKAGAGSIGRKHRHD